MSSLHHPPFGEADLSNCERELIHLAGSVQPHGALLVLSAADGVVRQASRNCEAVLGRGHERLIGERLDALGGDLAERVRTLVPALADGEALPLQVRTAAGEYEGGLHRHPGGGGLLIVELERIAPALGGIDVAAVPQPMLLEEVSAALRRFSAAASIGALADAAVQSVRELTGYDRVMVYKFDPDGHGKVIAEAREPRLDSLLGHHYPASDIPQRARELYLRNRVRVLVDVHYEPVPVLPRLVPGSGQELDMSLCYLRSMSPLHLQYLKNMGVTATLVISLVREGQLWGLIAAHHYAPRNLRYPLRAACDLLAEVIATRIAAIENYAHAQVAILVRRLEQRLVEATSIEGDWRLALFRNPRTLLQPLEATGAALFHDGEILSTGEVPATPELRELLRWVADRPGDAPFACSSVAKANPALDALTPSGVLAVRLSTTRPDYLMWFRKEQLLTVTWAGDPTKPVVSDNPLELSPRRSFAAWSEIVRGTALPWSATETALAHAIGGALVDIIVQVGAVRLLIAEHQLAQVRATVQSSGEPVAIADAQGRLLFSNPAFRQLVVGPEADATPATLHAMAELFTQPDALRQALQSMQGARQPWRGELALRRDAGATVPVALRIEVVPGRDGGLLGFMVIVSDLSDQLRAQSARLQLEEALQPAAREADDVLRAIVTNASLAAMDIAEAQVGPVVVSLLQEVESSTQRAAALYRRMRGGDV